jgi:hypothetical protein
VPGPDLAGSRLQVAAGTAVDKEDLALPVYDETGGQVILQERALD